VTLNCSTFSVVPSIINEINENAKTCIFIAINILSLHMILFIVTPYIMTLNIMPLYIISLYIITQYIMPL
jgi:hypothetical protein